MVSIEYASGPRRDSTVRAARKPPVVPRNLPEQGWSFGFQLGLSVNVSNGAFTYYDNFPYPASSFRFNAMNGIDEKWEVGFSCGFDPYLDFSWYGDPVLMASALGDLRYGLNKNKPRRPFLYTQAGYGFNMVTPNPVTGGGLNASLGFGASSRTRTNGIYSYTLGFRMQQAGMQRSFFNSFDNSGGYMRYGILGFEFKMEWRF